MFSGTSSLAPFDKPGKPLEQSIPQDDATLLGTFGVQFKRNERSEWCLLSYGQSAATDDGDVAGEIAAEESELNAQGMMRGFAGEMAVAAKNKKDSQSSKQLSDKSNQYKYDSSFFRSMETNSEAKLITGFFTLHEWQATHPTSQQEVFGSVVAWCPSNMDTARRVQKSMQDSQKNRPNTQQQNPQQQYTPQPHGAYYGGGAEADSDF